MLYHSAYKSSAADSLLAERNRIDSSHSMTDDIIEFVYSQTIEVMSPYTFTDRPMKLVLSFPDSELPWLVSTRV